MQPELINYKRFRVGLAFFNLTFTGEAAFRFLVTGDFSNCLGDGGLSRESRTFSNEASFGGLFSSIAEN